jgi:hypothetical protein
MKVIDNILIEWSFRCPDGIVSFDDPQKVRILFEIIKPLLTEDIDDDILNALIATDSPTKEKVLKYLKRVGDTNNNEPLENEVRKLLKPKIGRDDLIEQVIFIADSKQFEILSELKDYLNNPTVTYKDLVNNTNLNDLFELTGFPQEFINKIIDIKGSGQPAIGRGEIALAVFLKDTFKAETGDIVSSGKNIEVKASGSKIAVILPGKKLDILENPKFKDIIQKYGEEYKKGTWVEYIQSTYNKVSDKKQYINDVNDLLKSLYSEIGGININSDDLKSIDLFNKKIAVDIIKDYLNNQDLLVFNSDTKDYIYINGYKDYIEKIYNNTLFAANASDKIPRIYY